LDHRYKIISLYEPISHKHYHELLVEETSRADASPNGRPLATNSIDGERMEKDFTWRGSPALALSGGCRFAFSPDSRLLAFGDTHGAIRLVEVETGRELATLTPAEPSAYRPMFFNADGSHLAAENLDHQGIYVWDLRRIREQLAGLGLDWDLPPYPPADPVPSTPLRVEVMKEDPGGASKP
jgi:hypothetical protein